MKKSLQALLTLLGAIVSVTVPFLQQQALFERGSPERKIDLLEIGTINPVSDLSALREKATLSFTVAGQTVDNILINQAVLTNSGKTPIVPSDIFEPISVKVKSPFILLAVETQDTGETGEVALKWNRVSPTEFSAAPALLNPGDSVWVRIYSSNTDANRNPAEKLTPEFSWQARIMNMRGFSTKESPNLVEQASKGMWGILVMLSGWSFIFTVVGALTFFWLYLYLLRAVGVVRDLFSKGAIPLIVCMGALSIAAAESISTYLFGSIYTAILGVGFWSNGMPIVLHALLLGWLSWRLFRSRRNPPEAAGG